MYLGVSGTCFDAFVVPVADVPSISEDKRFSSNLHWLPSSREDGLRRIGIASNEHSIGSRAISTRLHREWAFRESLGPGSGSFAKLSGDILGGSLQICARVSGSL